jgi:hypothetical protein
MLKKALQLFLNILDVGVRLSVVHGGKEKFECVSKRTPWGYHMHLGQAFKYDGGNILWVYNVKRAGPIGRAV